MGNMETVWGRKYRNHYLDMENDDFEGAWKKMDLPLTCVQFLILYVITNFGNL